MNNLRCSARIWQSLCGGALALAIAVAMHSALYAQASICTESGSGLRCFEAGLQGQIWEQLAPFGQKVDLTQVEALYFKYDANFNFIPADPSDPDAFVLANLPKDQNTALGLTDPIHQCAYDGIDLACAPFANAADPNIKWGNTWAWDYRFDGYGFTTPGADTLGPGTLRFAGGVAPPPTRLFFPVETAI